MRQMNGGFDPHQAATQNDHFGMIRKPFANETDNAKAANRKNAVAGIMGAYGGNNRTAAGRKNQMPVFKLFFIVKV